LVFERLLIERLLIERLLIARCFLCGACLALLFGVKQVADDVRIWLLLCVEASGGFGSRLSGEAHTQALLHDQRVRNFGHVHADGRPFSNFYIPINPL